MREKLSSRLGFILISAGCAIGIGNVWRFPYVAGQSGCGWFLPFYLVALALIGLPVLVMEFAVGRASQRSLARAHETLTPEKPAWRGHGAVGLCGNFLLMMFYTTVAGWMGIYCWKTASGAFAGLDAADIGAAFDGVLADPWTQAGFMVGVSVIGAAVCGGGVQKGVERVTKWMMLALLALIVALSVNSVCLDGAASGVRFYLVPDLARMKSVGVVNVVINAINQAFFTLSLGIGAMTIFGSYISKSRTLLGESLHIVALDTMVAVCSGFIIIPACFAYGVSPGQGPGLIFVTLPNVFNHMPGGRIWGTLFFVFMSFAALSTVIAVFENIIAGLMDYFNWRRRTASAVVAAVMPLLSLPCVLGFNLWSRFAPLGKGTNVLDLEDFVVSDLLLPLGSLAFVIYCCHRLGWGWAGFLREVNAGEGAKFPAWLRGYCAWVLPVVIAAIFVVGVVRRFTP